MTSRRVLAPKTALLTAVAVGVLLVGCGTTTPSAGITAASTTSSSAAAAGSGGAPTSSTATAAILKGTAVALLGGRQVQIPSSTPTVLFFFALGCVDCAAGAQATAAAARTAGPTAIFLGVDLDPGVSADEVSAFLASAGATGLPVTVEASTRLATTYQVATLSTVVVVNAGGEVTYRAVDPTPAAILAAVAASDTR